MDLIVSANPLLITSNFEEVRAQLAEGLKKYEIEVTEETVGEAKKLATELNKLSTAISKVKTDKTREFSAPIEAFKTQVVQLVDDVQAAREKILAQVKTFEDKTRDLCIQLMTQHLNDRYQTLEVRQEFRTGFGTIAQLAGVSKVTKGGVLAKAAAESIDGLAQQGRSAQDRVDGRLARLEADCYKAGLTTPLQREHVAALLDLDDVGYSRGLERIIKIETERQAKAEAATKAKAEAEAREKIRREQEAAKPAEAAPPAPVAPAALVAPAAAAAVPATAKAVDTEKQTIVVVAKFRVPVAVGTDANRVRQWFRSAIIAAGLNELHSVEIEPAA